ncbi:MAG: M64 family metallopeptidase, partial [Candidatus Omnitrophota bacterium]
MLRNLATLLAVCLIVPLLALTIGLNEVRGETNVTKLIDNGDPATHVDLTIIGSGFAASEMETYKTKAQQNIDKMLTVNWFATNKTLFNVWRIDAVSPTSGVDLDDATINSMASQVPYDVLIVIHNYDGQESVNKPYVELYKYSHNYVVLAHELGHKIGKLDDEYWTSAMAYKCNGLSKLTLNIHDNASNEKWSDLISSSPYEGARFCEKGLWRPTENSIMRDSANSIYFDAVGLKAMDLGAGKILKTVESVAPSLSISGLQDNDTKSGSFTAQAVTSDASGIERVEFYWAKSGETSKSIKIDKTAPYDLSIDITKYQDGQYYLDTLSYDKNWNYVRKTILFSISNQINIPIIVSEALTQDTDYYIQTGKRQDMPGMNRDNEPLTVGIPLSEDSGITNISQLGLNGVSIQQFRPLAYWINGNIKWVLVDTQATVQANSQTTISLVSGTGNSGGSNLAIDNGSYLSVDTGTAQFMIKKSNFNMVDKAVVNGKELVQQNNSGGLSMVGYEDTTFTFNGMTQTLVKNTVYDSKNDPDSTAVIEENGPVRTVIKAMGSFKDTSGNRFMDYTVRLHFYKGKSYVKSQVIMRHGQEEKHPNTFGGYSQQPRTFSNMQVSIPLNLGIGKQFEFVTNKGIFSGNVDSSAYLYQAHSKAHANPSIENDPGDGSGYWTIGKYGVMNWL